MTATPTRRRLVQAAGALGLAAATGCRAPAPDPAAARDARLRAAAIERERRLVAAYTAALQAPAALPSPAGRDAAAGERVALLRGLRAEHLAHLAALDPLAPATASPAPAAARPDLARPDLAGLARQERAAAAEHAAAAVTAGRPLAAVLASLGASEASHAVVLAP